MNKEDFYKHWTLNYPETVPISHLFKQEYSDRWFRIHSLPKSKRYAEKDEEWSVLLNRQNQLITDLFGLGTPVFLVAGDYNLGDQRASYITDEEVFKTYSFTRLDIIELFNLDSEEYDVMDIYRPSFAEIIWEPNKHDRLLIEISNDNARAFFVSFDKKIIAAPYDGGVDFVLKDRLERDFYKDKYKEWLSEREDGL